MGTQVSPSFDVFMGGLEGESSDVVRKIITILTRVGEECIIMARNNQNTGYTDQTGNLRSSVGYAVVHDGVIVTMSNFEKARTTASEGSETGKSYIETLAKNCSENAITLIVVAGMDYAEYVEKIRPPVIMHTYDFAINQISKWLSTII